MENINLYLNKLCTILTKKKEACDLFVNNVHIQFDILTQALNFKNLLILIFFFGLFYFLLIFFKKLNNFIKIFSSFNFALFFTSIVIFPSNIAFTDTWQEIYNLISLSKKDYLFQEAAGHFFFGFRFFHLVLYKYLFLNYTFLHIFNFFIYLSSCLLLFFYISKFKNINILYLSLFIIFSGKWLNIFFDPANIVWTINFFLTVSYVSFIKQNDSFLKYLSIAFILILSFINFGSGIVLIIYSIIYGFCKNHKKIISFFYILFPIACYLIIFKFSKIFFQINVEDFSLSLIAKSNIFDLIKAYLVLSAGIFFPTLILHWSIIAGVGFVQNFLILYFIFFYKKFFLYNIIKFAVQNPFLIIGIMGCVLIAIIRPSNFDQIRYSSYSIFFQIGFFIFIFRSKLNNFNLIKNKIFLYFIICSYIISILGPYTGVHFAITRAAIYQKINNCIVNNNNNNCNSLVYNETMYKGTWFSSEKFNDVFNYLEKNKLSFMRR